MKKLVSMILTFVMVLSMAVPVMAADLTYSITIDNDVEGHTYEAYQIFTGDITKDTSTTPATWKISNAQWGDGVKAEGQSAFGVAETVAEGLVNETAAKAFAVQLQDYLSDTKTTAAYDDVNDVYVITGLKAGYYLIKDKDDSLAGGDASYTAYILKVAENTSLSPKASVPTSYKKVDDAADSTNTENGTTWNDSADYDIGDAVPFQLNGTLPENFGEYTEYSLIFHDEESAGLTFNPESVKVYVKHLQDREEVKSGYSVVTKADKPDLDCTFEIVMDDVRKLVDDEGKHIAVTKNSIIQVEYTSTLNEKAVIGAAGNPNTMYMEYSNNPNHEGDGETGKTKEDIVIVFTYKTVIDKVDGEGAPLKGAGFSLEKKIFENGAETWKVIKTIEASDATTFEFKGLDDGHYRVKEIDTPVGYNSIDDFYFEIVAQHDATSDAPKLTVLRANQIDQNGLTIDENIIFDATVDLTSGTISSAIVNKAGTTLPETGGMGTTLFYLVGAVLVIGAGVTLVARKRMSR